jgi:hypothetical protein
MFHLDRICLRLLTAGLVGFGFGLGVDFGADFGVSRAYADMPPPPGQIERQFAALIATAGYACPKVTDVHYLQDEPEAKPLAERGLDPYRVSCSNGKHFIVGSARRVPGPPRDRPPSPEPVVRPLD